MRLKKSSLGIVLRLRLGKPPGAAAGRGGGGARTWFCRSRKREGVCVCVRCEGGERE
jgi:hypothetical protein